MNWSPRNHAGFTLVELLIVVVILGILAGVVLPTISTSTEDTKVAAAQQNLQNLRSLVDLYKVQHEDVYPAYPVGGGTPTETLFVNQLTLASKKDGSTAALGTTGYPLGPYLRNGIPANPFNQLATVLILGDAAAMPAAADDATGWVFKPKTGELKCNSTFVTSDGRTVYTDF